MNKNQSLACVVLAAGKGTRMRSKTPKVAHMIAGRPMLGWVLAALEGLNPQKIVVVVGQGAQAVSEIAQNCQIAIQEEQNGTACALEAAVPELAGFDKVLVVMGDVPLIKTQTLQNLIDAHQNGGVCVLGASAENPFGYGRLVLDGDRLCSIVEEKDANSQQRQITQVNAGAWVIDGGKLPHWLSKIGNNNAAGERYLTDLPAIAGLDKRPSRAYISDDKNSLGGINNRVDLANIEACAQDELRQKMMLGGATLLDPSSVYFSFDTKIGRDVLIEQNVVFGKNVTIADGAHIKAFSHIEGARIEENAIIGPFARIRPNTTIMKNARIGNFVEIKASLIGDGSKIGHLAYVGDTQMGADVNFSAGAIVANYDGENKHKTTIEEGVMVGTNSTLVSPVNIGKGSFIAAGSTITKDVPYDSLAIARQKQSSIGDWNNRKGNKKL